MTDDPQDYMQMIRDWSALIQKAPRPISYFVMDHACPASEVQKGEDSRGNRYAIVNPSIMDGLKFESAEEHRRKHPMSLMTLGVPLYRRDQMVEGWPDNL